MHSESGQPVSGPDPSGPSQATSAEWSSERLSVTKPTERGAKPRTPLAIERAAAAGVPRLGTNAILQGRVTREGAGTVASLTFTAGPNAGAVLETALDGTLDHRDLYPGFALCAIEVAGAGSVTRELYLRENYPTGFELDFGEHGQHVGRVLDEDAQVIRGAIASLDGQDVPIDAAGWFHTPQSASGRALLLVQAPGYASFRTTLDGDADPAAPLAITLMRGCRLEIALDRAMTAGQVFVSPVDGGPRTRLGVEPAFPWHLVSPREVGATSDIVIEDLPACRVEVRVFDRQAESQPMQVWLRPQEPTRVALELRETAVIRGRVTSGGKPVRGARVEVQAANCLRAAAARLAKASQLFRSQPIAVLALTCDDTRTDANGCFTLGAPTTGGDRYLRVFDSAGTPVITRRLDRDRAELEIATDEID